MRVEKDAFPEVFPGTDTVPKLPLSNSETICEQAADKDAFFPMCQLSARWIGRATAPNYRIPNPGGAVN